MATVENKSNEKSIWAKVGSVIARSDKIIGRSLALPLNAVIYPMKPSSWSKSWGERGGDCRKGLTHLVSSQGDDSFFDRFGISFVKFFTYSAKPSNWSKPSWSRLWHDIKNGGRYVIGVPLEEYTQFEKDIQAKDTTQASKNLGVKVKLVDYKKGKMIFEASRVLGDASRLTSEQLDKIKKGLPNVTIDKGRNKVTIEVDVDAIIKELKREIDAQGLEVSEKQMKMLAIQRIAEEIDSTLKKFGKISGGEFKVHTDKKLLNAIAETLYRGSISKEKPVKKSAEAVTQLNEKPVQGPDPSETETLRSGAEQDDLSETFRWLFDDGSLPKIVEPLVNNGKKEEVRKAIEEAAQRKKQLAQNTGIDSKDLAKLSPRTGGCGAEAESKWQGREGQKAESQDSEKQNGFTRN